ncbi:alpha/beta hydrolase family protein [Ottowia testudinis]|uniref:Dienelactone hydrolase n=1 Tax=Ottowia testudinis TaxID=2816950 RepID=A0A975CLQ4_9BURK|nr:hypothetical protein [Ottowia testudinis]QTD46499.1 hypothetical protein J1M35_06350 [Ottowia testudinis]
MLQRIFFLAFLLALSMAMTAHATTAWPDYMPSLEPDRSESPVSAELPPDVATPAPGTHVPAQRRAWLGIWTGWAGAGRTVDLKIAIENVSADGATLVYAEARAPQKRFSERVQARWNGDELHVLLNGRVTLMARLRHPDVMEVQGRAAGQMIFAGVLSPQTETALAREVVHVPTPFMENNQPVHLEMLVFKPAGAGPFPTVLFNHGSTGKGDIPAMFTETWTSATVARFFNGRGWLVAFPQRRGRGKSDGLYDEGFNAKRSAYTCQVDVSLAGLDRALADVDAAAEALRARPDVDAGRMLIGGVSRGGLLAIAGAGARPGWYIGSINFVGGWIGEGCKSAAAINGPGFRRGSPFRKPTLWLYGERDSFYSMAHSRANFQAFIDAGGQGEFHAYDLGEGRNGHALHAAPMLWQPAVDDYLRKIAPNR